MANTGPCLGHNRGCYFGAKTEDGQLDTQHLGVRIGHNLAVAQNGYIGGEIGHGPGHVDQTYSQNFVPMTEDGLSCDKAYLAGTKIGCGHNDHFEARIEVGWTGVPADEFEHGGACDQAHFAGAKTDRDHDDHF